MTLIDPTRRTLMRGLTCCAGLPGLAALGATAAHAQETPAPSQPAGSGLSPEEALDLLKRGNAEFLTDAPYRAANTRERRLEIAETQSPFAVLVGCSDSRVSPELLFGRGLGELFIIRVAGNTVDLAAQGSVEYAIAELGVPLVVVLGHERCGAVHAAIEVVENNATFPGRIGDMVEPIIPAVLKAQGGEGELMHNSVLANVERVVEELKRSGPVIQEPLTSGNLKIVGAHYDLDDGEVIFMED